MSTAGALAPRMIGRQAQLQQLEDHLRQVRAGSGRVVLVAGEAGVGKTRLLHEVGIPPLSSPELAQMLEATLERSVATGRTATASGTR